MGAEALRSVERPGSSLTEYQSLQPSRELRLMVRCLELYYRQARPQKEIARALRRLGGDGLAAPQARLRRGFVRVELDLPRAEELEAALTEAFACARRWSCGGRARRSEGGARRRRRRLLREDRVHGIRVGLSCGFTSTRRSVS